MPAQPRRLKIALQKSGRLTEDAYGLLRNCGLDVEQSRHTLYQSCRNFPLDLLTLRDDDIPEYVQDGIADLGVVGRNVVGESGARVVELVTLGFGACRLMICVPKASRVRAVQGLEGWRIATSYPKTLSKFLKRSNVRCEIVELSGSVEIAPILDVADAICDLVSSGSTARVNGLLPILTVLESEAVLVANPAALDEGWKKDLVDRMMIRIKGSLAARGQRYMMLNAPADAVPKLRKIIPSLKSPTIVPLADDGMVALHSVIAEDVFWDVMEKLKRAGATDIIVVPIESIIR